MDADGKNITQLTQNGRNGYPSWSPDGQRIAFASDRDGENFHFQIYVMDADGKNITQLTQNGRNLDTAWSPDGQRIAFVSNRDGDWNIYVMVLD